MRGEIVTLVACSCMQHRRITLSPPPSAARASDSLMLWNANAGWGGWLPTRRMHPIACGHIHAGIKYQANARVVQAASERACCSCRAHLACLACCSGSVESFGLAVQLVVHDEGHVAGGVGSLEGKFGVEVRDGG